MCSKLLRALMWSLMVVPLSLYAGDEDERQPGRQQQAIDRAETTAEFIARLQREADTPKMQKSREDLYQYMMMYDEVYKAQQLERERQKALA